MVERAKVHESTLAQKPHVRVYDDEGQQSVENCAAMMERISLVENKT